MVALALVGVALLVLGALTLRDDTAPGASSVSKTSTTSVTAPPKDKGGTTTTEVSSTDTTTPGKPSIRSETLAGALLALGAVLVLCAAFFTRIQKVNRPGNTGIELIAAAEEATKEKVREKVKEDPKFQQDPALAIDLYANAWREIRPTALMQYTSPGDEYVTEAVDRAARSLR